MALADRRARGTRAVLRFTGSVSRGWRSIRSLTWETGLNWYADEVKMTLPGTAAIHHDGAVWSSQSRVIRAEELAPARQRVRFSLKSCSLLPLIPRLICADHSRWRDRFATRQSRAARRSGRVPRATTRWPSRPWSCRRFVLASPGAMVPGFVGLEEVSRSPLLCGFWYQRNAAADWLSRWTSWWGRR